MGDYDEILFSVDSTDISQVNVIKMDDMYHLRPSLYRDGEMVLTSHIGIDPEIVDVFDSLFMSATTSLILKKVKLNNNFLNILISIIYFELRITIDETEDNMVRILRYLEVYESVIHSKFQELFRYEPGDVMDVTFYYNENKSLAYAMVAKV